MEVQFEWCSCFNWAIFYDSNPVIFKGPVYHLFSFTEVHVHAHRPPPSHPGLNLQTFPWSPEVAQEWRVKGERWTFTAINWKVHPRSLTWNLKIMVSKRNLLFQWLIFRFHVKLQGCRCHSPYILVYFWTLYIHLPKLVSACSHLWIDLFWCTAGRSTAGTYSHHEKKRIWTKPPGNCGTHVNLQGCTLLETNSKFAPENHWLEDVFFCGLAYLTGAPFFVSGSILRSRNLTYPTWGMGKKTSSKVP